MTPAERQLEEAFIGKLCSQKYEYCPDIRDRATLEANFRQKFEALNKDRLLEMVTIVGHGTGKLDTGELKALALMLPHPAEQQRIATCLTSLDDLLTAQSAKLEALKTHKKGLMQQLLPSREEVGA